MPITPHKIYPSTRLQTDRPEARTSVSEIRLICQDWTPQAEAALTRDLMQLQGDRPDCAWTLVVSEDTAKMTPGLPRVLGFLGVTYKVQAIDENDPAEVPTLIYYANPNDKPQALCSPKNSFYRYVGQPVRKQGVSMGPPRTSYPDLPDRTRPLPPSRSLTNLPAPQQLNYIQRLPAWLHQ